MPPRNKRPKKGFHRIDAALDAMRPLGFQDVVVRKSVRELLKVYGDNGWLFIEEKSYSVLLDALLSEQPESDHENEGNRVHESRDLQGNTEISEEGQCSKVVPGGHDEDKFINELEGPEKQMETVGKILIKLSVLRSAQS